jgi:Uma2 family endonuclease
MSALTKSYRSVEDYLALEQSSEVRHEYENGEMREMPGGSETHSSLSENTKFALRVALKGKNCKVHGGDLRIKIPNTGLYTYPDVSVTCGERLFENTKRDSLLNPTVIFEVLSPSTERYDRGRKFNHYQTVESISDYMLVSQDAYQVEHFIRQTDNSWLLKTYRGLESSVSIGSLGCELSLSDIYEDVSLELSTP